jgi:hypothetical protein
MTKDSRTVAFNFVPRIRPGQDVPLPQIVTDAQWPLSFLFWPRTSRVTCMMRQLLMYRTLRKAGNEQQRSGLRSCSSTFTSNWYDGFRKRPDSNTSTSNTSNTGDNISILAIPLVLYQYQYNPKYCIAGAIPYTNYGTQMYHFVIRGKDYYYFAFIKVWTLGHIVLLSYHRVKVKNDHLAYSSIIT